MSGPDTGRSANDSALERLLRRDRSIALAGLAALAALAWAYVLAGAGLGMPAWKMTSLSVFPHLHSGGTAAGMAAMGMGAMAAAPVAWTPVVWALMIAMWWVMMIAMMAPSATPAILLYARVMRHAAAPEQSRGTIAPAGAFMAGYLSVWLAFSAIAAALQWSLAGAHLISQATMASQSRLLSGIVLIAAGIYQLSPLQDRCLSHCRAPASFLTQHWRPGFAGAIRLGALHGGYCVGCCWLLMALLFVGGVMNLLWIAALTILVLLEKVLPGGRWLARGTGVVLAAWGIATLAV